MTFSLPRMPARLAGQANGKTHLTFYWRWSDDNVLHFTTYCRYGTHMLCSSENTRMLFEDGGPESVTCKLCLREVERKAKEWERAARRVAP